MNKIIYCCTFLTLLSYTACDAPAPRETFQTLAHETWDRDSNYTFNIDVTQPGAYTISTCIRHSTDYKNKSISCYLVMKHDNLPDITEMMDVVIINDRGRWVGQGLKGLKTVVQPLNKVFHLDSTGRYTIELRHRMKEKQLAGIKDIGIRMTKYSH